MTLILLNGSAQVGKSTMAEYMCGRYGYGFLDAGTPFKCLIGFGIAAGSGPTVACAFKAFAEYRKRHSLEETLEYLSDNQGSLIAHYEAVKSLDKDATRDACISLAELVRCFDKTLWVKAAAKMAGPYETFVGFALDQAELDAWQAEYDGPVFVAALNCVDAPSIDDTREQVCDKDIHEVYTYKRNNSLLVAEAIAEDAKRYVSVVYQPDSEECMS